MEYFFIFWFILACIFLIAEVGHPGLFFFLPFSLAAFITAIVSIWFPSLIIQGICFLSISATIFLILHRWLNIRSLVHSKELHTNIDALIGQHGIVIEKIPQRSPGYVKVNGEKWLARSCDGSCIDVGTAIEIVDTRGAHVLVERHVLKRHV